MPRGRKSNRKGFGARKRNPRGISTSTPLSKVYSMTAQETPGYGLRNMVESRTHTIVKNYRLPGVLTTSTSVATFYGFYVAFNGISDYASYQAVFDEFKIVQAEVWLVPNLPTSTAESIGQSISVIDYSDSKTPTTVAGMLEYSTAVVGPATHAHYHKFTPQVDLAAFQAGATFGYATKAAPWLLLDNPAVQHYGVKLGVDPTSSPYSWDANVRLRCELRRSS